jgi:hypothetical protein
MESDPLQTGQQSKPIRCSFSAWGFDSCLPEDAIPLIVEPSLMLLPCRDTIRT